MISFAAVLAGAEEARDGIPQGVLTSLHKSLHKSLDETRTIHAWALSRNGVLLDEFYRPGYDKDSLFEIHSCSKSITGSLVAIALSQGKIKDLDQKISDFFPELLKKDDARWRDISIRHLLTNTSGIDATDRHWDEWRPSENWTEWILNRRIVSKPGSVFAYSTQNTHLLSAILEKATAMSLYDYAKKCLLNPAGMDSARLGSAPEGTGDGGNGFVMTVRDMIRFGRLYLNDGKWGRVQVIPEAWTKEAGRVHVDRHGEGTANYGYQFWVRNFSGEDVYFAWGWAGQFIFIIPSINVTMAFTGMHTGSVAVYFNAVRAVINACK